MLKDSFLERLFGANDVSEMQIDSYSSFVRSVFMFSYVEFFSSYCMSFTVTLALAWLAKHFPVFPLTFNEFNSYANSRYEND